MFHPIPYSGGKTMDYVMGPELAISFHSGRSDGLILESRNYTALAEAIWEERRDDYKLAAGLPDRGTVTWVYGALALAAILDHGVTLWMDKGDVRVTVELTEAGKREIQAECDREAYAAGMDPGA